MPLVKGVKPVSEKLEHTGSYLDGFGNKLTMYAYANPYEGELNYPKWREDGLWGKLAAGHGIVRFNKKTRKITMECWPRGVDVTKKDAKQFPGWPVTIDQQDNYAREAYGYLPKLVFKGIDDVVVQIIDQGDGEVVYTVGVNTKTFRPKVFKAGKYTVIAGNQRDKQKVFKDVVVVKNNKKTIDVEF